MQPAVKEEIHAAVPVGDAVPGGVIEPASKKSRVNQKGKDTALPDVDKVAAPGTGVEERSTAKAKASRQQDEVASAADNQRKDKSKKAGAADAPDEQPDKQLGEAPALLPNRLGKNLNQKLQLQGRSPMCSQASSKDRLLFLVCQTA